MASKGALKGRGGARRPPPAGARPGRLRPARRSLPGWRWWPRGHCSSAPHSPARTRSPGQQGGLEEGGGVRGPGWKPAHLPVEGEGGGHHQEEGQEHLINATQEDDETVFIRAMGSHSSWLMLDLY